MKRLILLFCISFLTACTAPLVSDSQKAQIDALPPEQQIDQILSVLGTIQTEDKQPRTRKALTELLDKAVVAIESGVKATPEQLNALNAQAKRLDRYYKDEKETHLSDYFIEKGASPLVYQARIAARKGEIDRLKHYYAHGLTRSYKDVYSPLTVAARYNQLEVVKYLIVEEGVHPDAEAMYAENKLNIPLYSAAYNASNPDIIDVLFLSGSQASSYQAMQRALINPKGGRIAERLYTYGAIASKQELNDAFVAAFQKGYTDSFEAFIRLGASPKEVGLKVCTVIPKKPEQVLLIDQTCNVDRYPYDLSLGHAIREGDTALVEAVLATGFDVNERIPTKHAFTYYPLEQAIYDNEPEIAKLLLFSGANPNVELGGTAGYPLDIALDNDRHALIPVLKEYGAVEEASFWDFDTVMKGLTITAIGTGIYASDVNAYHGSEVFAAAVSDVWSGGQTNTLAALNKRYLSGDISIKDPALAHLLKQQQKVEAIRHQSITSANQQKRENAKKIEQLERSRLTALRSKKPDSSHYGSLVKDLSEQEQTRVTHDKEKEKEKEKASTTEKPKAKSKQKPVPLPHGLVRTGNLKNNNQTEIQGTISQMGVSVAGINTGTMTVKYRLSSLMGEPLVSGSWKWDADTDEPLPADLSILLRIKNNGATGYIRLSPTVPKANSGYGFNVSGSPNWNSYICGYKGNKKTKCLGKEDAKLMVKGGSVRGFELSHK